LSKIFLPASWIYASVLDVRNWLFDKEYFKQIKFEVPVISVGNLCMGGAGKTPLVECIAKHFLNQNHGVAIVSRGYKRKSKGLKIVDNQSSVREVGDEPLQLFRKFEDKAIICICENRVKAINLLIEKYSELDLILLDDAYQHRGVTSQLNILLTSFTKPFYADYVFPSGMLRESRAGAKRADLIVVTKCPDHLDAQAKNQIESSLRDYTATDTPILFSKLKYQSPQQAFAGNGQMLKNVILITGIASSTEIVDYVRSEFNLIKHFEFDDHHNYTSGDIRRIMKSRGDEVSFLTTEKDLTKLEAFMSYFEDSLFVLPIEVSMSNFDMNILLERVKF